MALHQGVKGSTIYAMITYYYLLHIHHVVSKRYYESAEVVQKETVCPFPASYLDIDFRMFWWCLTNVYMKP